MKTSEVMKLVTSGTPMVVAEYRGFKAESMTYADKKNGGARVTQPIVKHNIEMGDQQAAITEFLPDGVALADVKPLHKKGDKVVVHILGVANVKGFASMRGVIHAYEPDAK